jgi:hypothetical protein
MDIITIFQDSIPKTTERGGARNACLQKLEHHQTLSRAARVARSIFGDGWALSSLKAEYGLKAAQKKVKTIQCNVQNFTAQGAAFCRAEASLQS